MSSSEIGIFNCTFSKLRVEHDPHVEGFAPHSRRDRTVKPCSCHLEESCNGGCSTHGVTDRGGSSYYCDRQRWEFILHVHRIRLFDPHQLYSPSESQV